MSAHPRSVRRPLVAIDELGRGRPLVLLHGLGASRDIWSLVAPELARGRRVVIPDVPGFGASAPAGPGFDLAQVAGRLARALAARGVAEPLDLVGHSLGGAVAVALAAARPRLVQRLVLIAPAGLQGRPPLPAELIGLAASGLYATRRRLVGLADRPWGRRLLLARAVADAARLSPLQARVMIDASARAHRVEEATASILRADLRPALRTGPDRLGLIWGERDGVVPPRLAGEIQAVRPDAELVTLPGVGHVPMIEAPADLIRALSGLLGADETIHPGAAAAGRILR